MKDKIKVCIYARKNNGDELSIQSQINKCHLYAERNGLDVTRIIIHKGQPNHKDLLSKLKVDIRKNKTRYLLIEDFTRIGRDIGSIMKFEVSIDRLGIDIISCSDNKQFPPRIRLDKFVVGALETMLSMRVDK